jgi:hypothetical protein
MPSTIYYVASLSTCVVVRADSPEAARGIGQDAIRRVVGNDAIEARTARPATAEETALHGPILGQAE